MPNSNKRRFNSRIMKMNTCKKNKLLKNSILAKKKRKINDLFTRINGLLGRINGLYTAINGLFSAINDLFRRINGLNAGINDSFDRKILILSPK